MFFISPLSLQADRYTLSELKILQDKWPTPRGRVLPTLLTPMDLNTVPPYLRAVSICKPKGNIAADVSYEVSRMCDALRDTRRRGRVRARGHSALCKRCIAAVGFGVLAALISRSTNQLADVLSGMGLAKFVLHGISLSCMVWLAALLFGVREPIVFGGLAAGCIAAFLFENLAWRAMGPYSAALDAAKSMIFALFAALVLSDFRNVSRWACLAMSGLIAGYLLTFEAFGPHLRAFIWEALLVSDRCLLPRTDRGRNCTSRLDHQQSWTAKQVDLTAGKTRRRVEVMRSTCVSSLSRAGLTTLRGISLAFPWLATTALAQTGARTSGERTGEATIRVPQRRRVPDTHTPQLLRSLQAD